MKVLLKYAGSHRSLVDWSLFLKDFIYLLLERGEGKEKEKHWCGRETSIGYLPYVPPPETELATQACALTGNQTGNLPLCGTMSHQLSHTVQGWSALYCLGPFCRSFLSHSFLAPPCLPRVSVDASYCHLSMCPSMIHSTNTH